MDLLFNCDLDELRKSKYFPLFCVFAAVDVALFCEDLRNYAAGRKLQRLVDRTLGY